MNHQEYDLIVIGAGPAGLICAGTAAQEGKQVLLLERNRQPGKKLRITGKGRCNVTNCCEAEELIEHVKSNPRFLYSAFRRFSAYDTMAFFEELGVPLKVERGARVFPVSDCAGDIVAALERFIRQNGVSLKTGRAEALVLEEGALRGVKTTEGKTYRAGRVAVTTGGMSYPGTGSTGDGYRLAKQAGHKIIPLKPSLVPVETQEAWCRELMGLSLRNTGLTLWKKGAAKPLHSDQGEMLFTHFGVSGPMILTASLQMQGEDLTGYQIVLDLKPALSEEELDARILRDFEKYPNKDFINSLKDLLPRKLIPVIVELSGIQGTCKPNQITREQRRGLGHLLKNLTLTPKRFRPIEEAIVTTGGVEVSKVNPKTMESKLLSGLYFAGEVLDVDATTGGFNLQIAFSTGYCAGKSV